MAKLYADLIEFGLKEYAKIPKFLKTRVKKELEERGLGELATE